MSVFSWMKMYTEGEVVGDRLFDICLSSFAAVFDHAERYIIYACMCTLTL